MKTWIRQTTIAASFLFLVSVLAACQTHDPSSVAHVTPQEFADRITAKGDSALVIDVRTPGEYADGYIEGARLLDYYGPNFAAEVAQLPKDKHLFIYCRSGSRSNSSVSVFLNAGFKHVTNLAQGMNGWQGASMPVKRAE